MKVAIIGGGQQGASIARALNGNNGCYQVSVFDVNKDYLDELRGLLAQDNAETVSVAAHLGEAVEDADILILATPIDTFGTILRDPELLAHLKSGAIVTDIGSAKAKSILEIKQALPQNALYVPGHPIVGAAGVGPSTSKPSMYTGEAIAIVPQQAGCVSEVEMQVAALWQNTGASIKYMDALSHDILLGNISHLEHVIAFSLTEMQEGLLHGKDYRDFGNTTLDITRIAHASVPMWNAIFEHNQGQVLNAANGFRSQLNALKDALNTDGPEALEALLRPAHQFRKEIAIDERPRESFVSEVIDFIDHEKIEGADARNVKSLSQAFNAEAKSRLAQRIALPAMISAAITRNAMTVENDLHGVKIAEMANPSFKDGSSVMLSDPAYVANVLYFNRAALLEKLSGFEEKFDRWTDQIGNFNAADISAHINEVSRIRQEMPVHRSHAERRLDFDVRPQADAMPLPANNKG